MQRERALLAGGCFWGMEELIRHLPGVIDTTVGYTGGTTLNPTYDIMRRGGSGHAEAIEVIFDPARLSYRALLEFFFAIHNPSTLNRQGNDVGPSYRSAIFYLSPTQRDIAQGLIEQMTASRRWPGKIVTQVVSAGAFYPAESAHQDYLKRNPHGYTCHYFRPEWQLAK